MVGLHNVLFLFMSGFKPTNKRFGQKSIINPFPPVSNTMFKKVHLSGVTRKFDANEEIPPNHQYGSHQLSQRSGYFWPSHGMQIEQNFPSQLETPLRSMWSDNVHRYQSSS